MEKRKSRVSDSADRLREMSNAIPGAIGDAAIRWRLMAAALREGARLIETEVAKMNERRIGVPMNPADTIAMGWCANQLRALADELEGNNAKAF